MRLIKLEELEVGDEIIIGGNRLKYLKVLKKPVIKSHTGCEFFIDPVTGTGEYNYNKKIYKSVRCSIRYDDKEYITKNETLYHFKDYVFEQDISKHNHRANFDLNYKDIFLVKKESDTTDKSTVFEQIFENN